MSSKKISVAVFFGGCSGEHDVSLESAASVMAAADTKKYNLIPVGITRDGCWLAGGDPMRSLRKKEIPGDCFYATLVTNPSSPGLLLLDHVNPLKNRGFIPLDAAFPVLHGPYGEDGTVQGLLEMAGLPYVGGGVLSSAASLDKSVMKVLFLHRGLPLGEFIYFNRGQWSADSAACIKDIELKLDYPCFVKPANMGSSVGVSKVNSRSELTKAVEAAFSYDKKVVVEEYIPGREIELSVLGDDYPAASTAGEIIPCNEFYDFKAKYIDGRSELLIPAPLPEEVQEQLKEYAIAAFKAVECSGMGRVDFFYQEEAQKIFVNEINTIPGFTEISMYPKLWEASGIPYPKLIDKLFDIAFERHRQKKALLFKQET